METIPELAKRGGRKKPFITYPISKILKEIEQLDKLGGTLIVLGDKAYPRLLSEIEDAPPVLMALGNIDLFENQNFAIVGARNASAVGLKIASRFSQELGINDYVISSGLARGIDAAAHKGALKSGTIAVVAGGVDNIYPRENTDIYHQIKESGLIISEMPLGTEPQDTFPAETELYQA